MGIGTLLRGLRGQRTDWTKAESVVGRWSHRAEAAASLIPAGSDVLDLGCGGMALRNLLPEGCTYTGCDLVEREPGVIVCDFNKGQFPVAAAAKADAITALGVLEHLTKPEQFIRNITAPGCDVVLTYHPHSERKRSRNWRNSFTRDELLAMFAAHGFGLAAEIEVSPSQAAYRFSKAP